MPDATFVTAVGIAELLVLLLIPLTVVLLRILVRVDRVLFERVPFTSGAPPPANPWRCQPPKTAPPCRPDERRRKT